MSDNKIQVENLTNRGRGRPKGAPNKNTQAIKDMLLASLDQAGGQEYFLRQAEENPNAYRSEEHTSELQSH